MDGEIPQVIFKYAYPLDGQRRLLWEYKDFGPYPSMEDVKQEAETWRALWAELNEGDRIIKEIIKLTGVTYPRDIEAYVIGKGIEPMSTPLILPMEPKYIDYEQEGRREELIVHELLHIFVAAFDDLPRLHNYWNRISEKYAEEATRVKHHIIIYALLIKIFEEFLPDFEIENYVKDEWTDYVRALEIAREEGPENIITEFRELTKGK